MAKAAAKETEAETKDEVEETEAEKVTQPSFEDMVSGAGTTEDDEAAPHETTAADMSRQELATYSQKPDFDADDILIPRLRLAQGLTPEVMDNQAKVGEWLLTGCEPVETAAFLPMYFSRRRERRDGEDNRNILCTSQDAFLGEGNPGGNCKECPKAKWQVTDSGGRRPPECTFFYSYLGYSITHESVVMLNFKRTGLPAGKVLNTIVARNGLARVAVELGSSRVSKNNRVYYIPVVRPASMTPEEIAVILKKSMF